MDNKCENISCRRKVITVFRSVAKAKAVGIYHGVTSSTQ